MVDELQLLEKKLHELANKTANLNAENEKMKAELKFFEKDSEGIKKTKSDIDGFQTQKNQIKEKLTKLLNKFSEAGL
ncbi:MAG: hypothetical protein V2A57_04980 [Elusimicrobiota bacterium]|nr:hypothetical protein [Elusimicrobiota bacterium]